MDIAIDPAILRTRQLLASSRWVLVVLGILVLLVLFREWLAPSVKRSELRTAVVERGAISTEVLASGTVVPMMERVLISPVTSSIREVFLPLGSKVRQGDEILKIDSTQIELELNRLRDQLRLKDLEIEGIQQQQQQQLRVLRNQQALASIDFQSQTVTLQRYETLFKSNIVSEFDFETEKLKAQKAELQLQQLAQQITDTIASDSNTLEQRHIERQLLQQQLTEQEQLQRDTTVRASGDGIITVLASQLGQNVMAGAELVRISDLSSYRIDATLSDFYLHQISVGMPVQIDLGNSKITGTLSQILPSVDNGSLRLQIELDQPGNAEIKPNQRVEAGILTQQRNSGTRVTNGIVFNGSGQQDIFVLQDGKAIKRTVEVGLLNSAFVEIVSGLQEGEEIIISDMKDYQHLDEVAIDD